MTTPSTCTRRAFLARSAGALSVLTLSGRSFAAGQPPSERVRVAFSGIGWHGVNMLTKYAPYAAAVCDVDGARLREAVAVVEKATGKPCPAVQDYRKLLDMKDVDAVFIGREAGTPRPRRRGPRDCSRDRVRDVVMLARHVVDAARAARAPLQPEQLRPQAREIEQLHPLTVHERQQ